VAAGDRGGRRVGELGNAFPGCRVHGDWMFEGATHPQPSVEAFIDEMARLTIDGLYR
jgi:hypothetical protein